jgi:hypothetical protein
MNAHRATRALGVAVALGLPLLAGADREGMDLSGTWTWSWKDANGGEHTHVLEVEGTGSKAAARERFDKLEPVKINDLVVDGKKVNFSVLRGDHRAEYSGTIDAADTINGRVLVTEKNQTEEYTWTAKRKPRK